MKKEKLPKPKIKVKAASKEEAKVILKALKKELCCLQAW